MSRSKKWKLEWSFFLDSNGRRKYAEQCRRCLHPGNLVVEGADKKTYEAPYQCRLQDRKNAIFNPNHDIFSFLSVRLDA